MAHEMTSVAHRGRRAHLAALVIVLVWMSLVIVLGYLGYAKAGHPFWDRIYYSLQMFVLEAPHPEPHMNWELEIARFLAPTGELLGLMVGLVAATIWWTDRFRLAGLRLTGWIRGRKHVVICGIGRKGLQLVRDFRQNGQAVLVIDKQRDNPLIETCDQLGAVVLIGDATKNETLERAILHRAELLIATCGDDGANVEIAIRAERLCAGKGHANDRLRCYIHIVDLELRTLFRQQKILARPSSLLEVTMFNAFENSARLLLAEHFLDYGTPITEENDPRQAHLVVFGFGQLGESIVLQAVKQAHFPNGKKLRVTVIDRDAARKFKRFLVRYEAFRSLSDAAFIQSEAERPAVLRRVEQWCQDRDSIVTFVVAFDSDAHSLSFGLTLLGKLRQHGSPIFVRTESNAGLSKLLADVKEQSDLMSQIRGFGKVEEASSIDAVVGENMNRFAMKIHDEFVEKRRAQGRSADDPSMKSWQELDPDLKESNWQQAEHIRAKLRAIRCDTAAERKRPAASQISDGRVETINDDDAAKLAKMEHHRWIAERSLAGWRYGTPKDVGRRLHPDLKPWAELTEAVQAYDVEAVKLIPHLLLDLDHKVIYRKPTGQP
jgi:TrkA-N domain/RyR domain